MAILVNGASADMFDEKPIYENCQQSLTISAPPSATLYVAVEHKGNGRYDQETTIGSNSNVVFPLGLPWFF